MTTSGTDAGRFMLAMLNQSQGGALLEEGTWKQMFGPGLGADQLGTLAEGKQMGLGFFDESRNGHQIVGHEGGTVFQAELEIYPNDGSGVFVAVNGEGKDGAAALKDDLMRGFSDRYYPGSEPDVEDRPSVSESRQHARVAAGTYTSSRAPMTSFSLAAKPPDCRLSFMPRWKTHRKSACRCNRPRAASTSPTPSRLSFTKQSGKICAPKPL